MQQIFWLVETLLFFFRECFAIPDSLSVVPGFKNFSIVNPNND
jgi:hypothetical protein